ncbi:MAG: hypothetical protein F4Y27_07035 [Acidimicrobiaceae bacterium]|nr:hypothetical protein [Acidimicrobiaceae bacterium]MXW62768.1 hypothetical protein [Acidimicrobiaceae bacterium]MXW76660.1 hypothetical protein [Acidimicrobiaceae bacterium]MYA74414.1 hypothetical protein [Acidimicrobiaceae bacterium]MYC43084.1 hypothetical protein [Acidimicrobiaceae bacterium]
MPSEKILPTDVACRDLVDELVSTDESLLSLPTRVHVAECLRCQAELASYRRLRRMMRTLANAPIDLDPMLEHDIRDLLDQLDQTSARRIPARAAATLGGIAAAAGVIALAKRQRRATRLAI